MDSQQWSLSETQWEREYDNRLEDYRMHHVSSESGVKGVVVSDHDSKESFILIEEDFCVDVEI